MPCCAVEYLPGIKFGKYISVEMTWGVKTARWETLGPNFIRKNVYALDIQLDRLQFTEPRASCISCYFGLLMVQYSCTIHKKNQKNPEAMVHLQYCNA